MKIAAKGARRVEQFSDEQFFGPAQKRTPALKVARPPDKAKKAREQKSVRRLARSVWIAASTVMLTTAELRIATLAIDFINRIPQEDALSPRLLPFSITSVGISFAMSLIGCTLGTTPMGAKLVPFAFGQVVVTLMMAALTGLFGLMGFFICDMARPGSNNAAAEVLIALALLTACLFLYLNIAIAKAWVTHYGPEEEEEEEEPHYSYMPTTAAPPVLYDNILD